jgi:GntR family transcriptional regulator
MLIHLDKHGGVPVYRQIVDQVRQQIASRQLAPETQLTSVRDLAAELGVNPMTVSKAYSILERDGLVERRAGLGLFVAANGPTFGRSSRLALLEPTLRKAAVEARHLGIDEADAQALFAKLYRRLTTTKGDGREQ